MCVMVQISLQQQFIDCNKLVQHYHNILALAYTNIVIKHLMFPLFEQSGDQPR